MADWDEMVLVGRVARPHGLRGQVIVNPETDFVEERFRAGATFWTRSTRGDEQLTMTSARVQNGRPVIGFEGFSSIEDVERLAGLDLRVPEEELQPLERGRVLPPPADWLRGGDRGRRARRGCGEGGRWCGGQPAGSRGPARRSADSAGRRRSAWRSTSSGRGFGSIRRRVCSR